MQEGIEASWSEAGFLFSVEEQLGNSEVSTSQPLKAAKWSCETDIIRFYDRDMSQSSRTSYNLLSNTNKEHSLQKEHHIVFIKTPASSWPYKVTEVIDQVSLRVVFPCTFIKLDFFWRQRNESGFEALQHWLYSQNWRLCLSFIYYDLIRIPMLYFVKT